MLDNLQERVENLARAAVLSDPEDLPGLVSLQEQATTLAAELDEAKAGEVAELARSVSKLAESIVLRSVEDLNAAFGEIGKAIDRLQTAAVAPSAPEPAGSAGAKSDEDRELVTAWITGCDGLLGDLEDRLLVLDRSPSDPEVIGEIRRMLHTLKGECGVLSLHDPMRLCHEAESLIDARIESGANVPIDPLLMLLDWLKGFVSRLAADQTARPEGAATVMQALMAARGTPAETPTAPAREDPSVEECAAAQTQSKDATPPTPAATVSHAEVSEPTTASAAAPTEAPAALPPAEVSVERIVDPTPVQCSVQAEYEQNLPEFLCESKDHLAAAEEALLALDQDRTNRELINTVFRAFHSIKGASSFMAIKPVVSLAHSAEQMLDGARAGTLALGRSELDLILASCDMMSQLLGVLEGAVGPTVGDLRTLVKRLDIAAGGSGSGAAPAGGAVTQVAPAAAAAAVPVAPGAVVTGPVQAAPERKESTAAAQIETKDKAAPAARAPEAENGQKSKKSDQTVKVSTTRMDSLVTMVGELVIAQQMIVQDVGALGPNGQRVQRTLGHMSKMIRELQEVSMSLRMVNLKGTFQKMTRLVRDVSQRAGKQIEVVTEGEDVELDRNVVEAITDPLIHMIRNACDHGVEGPDERRAAGKPTTGRVLLRAYHAGGSIMIEIADDGRGLRREKLLAKAKSKGLLPADVNESAMPDGEVFGLIFLPGFSTAEQVTDISGRGVGMDVVRRNIEALRGKVEIRSVPGQGTTFLLRLPLTMAIIDGMVVRVGRQRYVLPTLSIQQSFRPQSGDIKTVVGAGEMVKVRGSMLPIYRLDRVLELTETDDRSAEGLLIVVETHDARFCLMVDEILGQHSVVIKTLTQAGQTLKGVSGGAILGDGRVALILDVAQVAGLAWEGSRQVGAARPGGDVGAVNVVSAS